MTGDSTLRFRPLTSIAEFDDALAGSVSRPVFVFKHSYSCGTSAAAHESLGALLDGDLGAAANWFLVDVRAHRLVSTAIAERVRIRHESPQVLLIVTRQVRWHASHYRVSAESVRMAWAQLEVALSSRSLSE